MDSFIDKLAQKFTAQEIIKANSSAEAAELKRTREQVQQYENCLEEMKNVNESMKESLVKLEQTLSLDLEKFGQVQVPTEDINSVMEDGVDDILAAIEENMNALKETQNEAKLQQDLAQEQMSGQLRDIQEKLSGQLAGQIQSIQDCVSGQLGEQLQGVQNSMSGLLYDQIQSIQSNMAEQMQGMQGAQSNIAEQMQGLQGTQSNMAERMQSIQELQDKFNGHMLGQMQDMQQVQEAQEKLSIQITGQLHAVQDKLLQQMKAERALALASQEEGNKFSEEQITVLKEQSDAQLASMREQLGGQLDTKLGEQLSTQKEQIADYVHKENVKVYRNVQAVVVDEAGKQTENMTALINKVMTKNQMLMRLVIASVACSGLSLAAAVFLILRSLGIF